MPIGDAFVSREHCVLRAHAWMLEVMDLPWSRNGTHVNDQMVPRGTTAPLVTGDRLRVGRSTFEVRVIDVP